MPLSVCFTGHRQISENLIPSINGALEETIKPLIIEGATSFLNGGSYGFDLITQENGLRPFVLPTSSRETAEQFPGIKNPDELE